MYFLYLGGILGYIRYYKYNSIMKNCVNYGGVTHSGKSSGLYIGGVAGYSGGSSFLSGVYNCLNYGSITHGGAIADNLHLGGIVGSSYYITIGGCVSGGKISFSKSINSNSVGSIVGISGPEHSSTTLTSQVIWNKFNLNIYIFLYDLF